MDNLKIYGYEMARVSEVYVSTLSTIMKPHGLERCFVPLLYIAEHSGKATQKDMGEALRRDKVSVLRMVDYLSERGLVERQQDKLDRRCQILVVTKKGVNLVPLIKKGIEETNNLILKGFTPEERNFFTIGMDKIYDNLKELPEPEFLIKAINKKSKETI